MGIPIPPFSHDLSWNEHGDSIHKKANKRLFVLREGVGLGTNDLLFFFFFFCNLITVYFSFLPYNYNNINFCIHYRHYNFLKK